MSTRSFLWASRSRSNPDAEISRVAAARGTPERAVGHKAWRARPARVNRGSRHPRRVPAGGERRPVRGALRGVVPPAAGSAGHVTPRPGPSPRDDPPRRNPHRNGSPSPRPVGRLSRARPRPLRAARPEDPRPRQAIEQARAWVRGEVTTIAGSRGGGPAMAPPGTCGGSTTRRVRRRPGGAVAHVAAHELGAAAYAIRAAVQPRRKGRRRRGAPRVPVAARTAPGGDPRARPRRPADAQRDLLVGVRGFWG